jgi:hypothetical protein
MLGTFIGPKVIAIEAATACASGIDIVGAVARMLTAFVGLGVVCTGSINGGIKGPGAIAPWMLATLVGLELICIGSLNAGTSGSDVIAAWIVSTFVEPGTNCERALDGRMVETNIDRIKASAMCFGCAEADMASGFGSVSSCKFALGAGAKMTLIRLRKLAFSDCAGAGSVDAARTSSGLAVVAPSTFTPFGMQASAQM